VPAGFGAVLDSAVLLDHGLSLLPTRPEAAERPDAAGRHPVRLLLDRAQTRGNALVVLVGEGGLALRLPRGADRRLPTHMAAGNRNRPLPAPVRDFLARALTDRGRTDPAALAAARELLTLSNLPRRPYAAPARALGASLDLAVPVPGGGLFVAGWLHDPQRMVDRFAFTVPGGRPMEIATPSLRFARDDVSKLYKLPPGERPGFAAFLPGPETGAAGGQVRGDLVLRSGERVCLMAPRAPLDLAAARAAVLGAVPPQALGRNGLAEVIAPAVRALHAAHMADRPAPEVIRWGAEVDRPDVSVIIPLYRNLEFLRFQLSSFATDRTLWAQEILFLLDSPEQRDEVEHFLAGLHGLYGLPMTLIVQARNYGYSAANNTAAAFARGRHLLFLNSDVIPDRPGWLPRLAAVLDGNPQVGAVGPKLLFDDDSLQHAGLYFDRDPSGRWYNHHYFKGMPRDFHPACKPRRVPGVTGACLLMSRGLFRTIGGFSEDYVIGDFEDSDLCLRIRAEGCEIVYEPRVELYHLERRSISRHTGYTRGVASLYNGWLHAGRWSDAMADLMRRDWSPTIGDPR